MVVWSDVGHPSVASRMVGIYLISEAFEGSYDVSDIF